MLEEMRSLALDFIYKQLGNDPTPTNFTEWFLRLRQTSPGLVFPYLVEDIREIKKVYTIYPDGEHGDLACLEVEDLTKETARRLPFKQYRARAIGPVIKRSVKKKGLFSPETTTQELTLKYFEQVGSSKSLPWAGYFKEITSILKRPRIKILGQGAVETGAGKPWTNIYAAAVALIPETKGTVLLTITDYHHQWPGDRREYINYLANELATLKYCTGNTPIREGQTCSLCGIQNTSVYPNAVKGAGINIGNVDRAGAFPGVMLDTAWKGYALCLDCADLLFIYKNHVSKQFFGEVAGEKALLLPLTGLDGKKRQKLINRIEKYVPATKKGVAEHEEHLLSIMAEEPAVTNITILWAKFGQNIENLRGVVTDVLPSRLGALSKFNQEANRWQHPVFPVNRMTRFDLGLSCLQPFLKRPGGKKAKQVNASQRLFQLKRSMAAALYRKEQVDPNIFWQEIMTTARWYLTHTLQYDKPQLKIWYLLKEDAPKANKEPYLTMAGWIRHVALLIYYLQRTEVFPMTTQSSEPKLESLKPYFGNETGIDTKDKAFAFLLGVLYGKVMEVQAARGVNVGANALTWLKRLTLTGDDLPGLYNKVREKLLAYETESNEAVRAVIQELGQIGTTLGNQIKLDETTTCYFLLLGQSLTTTILPSKKTTTARKE